MNRRNCVLLVVLVILSWAVLCGLVFAIWVMFEQGWMTNGL